MKIVANEKRWTALACLCTAQFLAIMDTSTIVVALPAIQTDLGYSNAGLHRICNAYVIFFGGFLLLGGPRVQSDYEVQAPRMNMRKIE